jgi:hypothetical protein
LPNRKLLNQVFLELSVMAGCDAIMIDPTMNPPADVNAFYFASRALTGRDEYSVQYLKYARALKAA